MHIHKHHKFQIKSAAKTRFGFLMHVIVAGRGIRKPRPATVIFIQIKIKKLRIYFLRGQKGRMWTPGPNQGHSWVN